MWPSCTDFSDAIQNPSSCFSDDDLKLGNPALDRLGLPLLASGQFAAVFKLKMPGNAAPQAIRCFTRDLGDRAHRYKAVNTHLNACKDVAGIGCLAKYEYDREGIIVRGKKYPLLVMEWVEGNTLDVSVERNLKNKDALIHLANQWVTTMSVLREAKIAHGDLQHGNVMVQSNMQLKLVDLDGMHVPEMVGLQACELGHLDYQHPGRTPRHFDLKLDNFSALVIHASLLALAEQPELWGQFHGEGLIMRQADFKSPAASKVLKAIKPSSPQLVAVLNALQAACLRDPSAAPFLNEIVTAAPQSKLPSWMTAPINAQSATISREAKLGAPAPDLAKTRAPQPPQDPFSSVPKYTSYPTASVPTTASSVREFSFDRFVGFGVVGFIALGVIVSAFSFGYTGMFWSSVPIAWWVYKQSFITKPAPKPVIQGTSTSRPSYQPPRPPFQIPPARRAPTYSPPQPPPSAGYGSYVGSTIRLIFHRSNCKWAVRVSRRNRVLFTSAGDARGRGYRPCKVCNP